MRMLVFAGICAMTTSGLLGIPRADTCRSSGPVMRLTKEQALALSDVDLPAYGGARKHYKQGFEAGNDYSTTRSSNFRLALRAGLKMTISQPMVSARQAQNMAILNVFPKRRGVLRTRKMHKCKRADW